MNSIQPAHLFNNPVTPLTPSTQGLITPAARYQGGIAHTQTNTPHMVNYPSGFQGTPARASGSQGALARINGHAPYMPNYPNTLQGTASHGTEYEGNTTQTQTNTPYTSTHHDASNPIRPVSFTYRSMPQVPDFGDYGTAAMLVQDLNIWAKQTEAWARGFQSYTIMLNHIVGLAASPRFQQHPENGFRVEVDIPNTPEGRQWLDQVNAQANAAVQQATVLTGPAHSLPSYILNPPPQLVSSVSTPAQAPITALQGLATGDGMGLGLTTVDDEVVESPTPAPRGRGRGGKAGAGKRGGSALKGKVIKPGDKPATDKPSADDKPTEKPPPKKRVYKKKVNDEASGTAAEAAAGVKRPADEESAPKKAPAKKRAPRKKVIKVEPVEEGENAEDVAGEKEAEGTAKSDFNARTPALVDPMVSDTIVVVDEDAPLEEDSLMKAIPAADSAATSMTAQPEKSFETSLAALMADSAA